MLLALAFIPVADVPRVYRKLFNSLDDRMKPVLEYFKTTYVGVTARGRRAAVHARYPPAIWNQRETALAGLHKTNNVSEGSHNRFRLFVGKDHPDSYYLLLQIQKEQADTESAFLDLCQDKPVKSGPKKKWIEYQERIQTITNDYENYRVNKNELDFSELIGSNIIL